MKILLIEDDVEISDMLKDFLMSEEFEVVTVWGIGYKLGEME